MLRAQILAVPLTNWVTVDKSFHLFVSHFLTCKVEITIIPSSWVSVRMRII